MGIEVVRCWHLSCTLSPRPTPSLSHLEDHSKLVTDGISVSYTARPLSSSLHFSKVTDCSDALVPKRSRSVNSLFCAASTGLRRSFSDLSGRKGMSRPTMTERGGIHLPPRRASFGDVFEEGLGSTVEELALECYTLDTEQVEEIPIASSADRSVEPRRGSQDGSDFPRWNSELRKNAFFSLQDSQDGTGDGRSCSVDDSFVHEDLKSSLSCFGSFSSSYASGRSYGAKSLFRQGEMVLHQEGQIPTNDAKDAETSKLHGVKQDVGGGSLQRAGVSVPLSLRMLKRRQFQSRAVMGSEANGVKEKLVSVGDSFKNAFSSMVFMIRTLQNHTFQLRQLLFYEDLQELVNMVQKELHFSFVWLFQQVFSCTPELMVLVMVLLADFTVFSMGNNVALAAAPSARSSSALVSVLCDGVDSLKSSSVLESVDRSIGGTRIYVKDLSSPSLKENMESLRTENGGAGSIGGKSPKVAGGADGNSWSGGLCQGTAMFQEEDLISVDVSSRATSASPQEYVGNQSAGQLNDGLGTRDDDDDELLSLLWEEALEELQSKPDEYDHTAALDQHIMECLVAPVSVKLEPDNYVCYDRTDLTYQQAISMDSKNPLLLANYAQFLHLVRHDYNRAEEFFHQALKADPVDGDVIIRFASFLWIARRDIVAAERAYRAAVASDPNNPFHAGSYAHFLWHSGDEEISCPMRPTA